MTVSIVQIPTSHVFRVERKRGPAWYATYRLPDGRQVQKKLGPAWTDRGRKPSTVRGYRSAIAKHLLPAFGSMAVEDVTPEAIERWSAGLTGSIRGRNKLLIQMHGILGRAKRVYGLQINAAAEVGKFPQRAAGDVQVFSPEEVWSLVRAAGAEQDAAVYLTAAFTGLRMGELPCKTAVGVMASRSADAVLAESRAQIAASISRVLPTHSHFS